MHNLQFYPETQLLLLPSSDEKVHLLYDDNRYSFPLPLIGPRPPFYYNPRYRFELPRL